MRRGGVREARQVGGKEAEEETIFCRGKGGREGGRGGGGEGGK